LQRSGHSAVDIRSTGTPFARSVDGPDADTTAAVDIGAFEAQVSIEDIPDKTINEDGQLQFTFNIGGGANVTNVLVVSQTQRWCLRRTSR
jgi:hypothetical protein